MQLLMPKWERDLYQYNLNSHEKAIPFYSEESLSLLTKIQNEMKRI